MVRFGGGTVIMCVCVTVMKIEIFRKAMNINEFQRDFSFVNTQSSSCTIASGLFSLKTKIDLIQKGPEDN